MAEGTKPAVAAAFGQAAGCPDLAPSGSDMTPVPATGVIDRSAKTKNPRVEWRAWLSSLAPPQRTVAYAQGRADADLGSIRDAAAACRRATAHRLSEKGVRLALVHGCDPGPRPVRPGLSVVHRQVLALPSPRTIGRCRVGHLLGQHRDRATGDWCCGVRYSVDVGMQYQRVVCADHSRRLSAVDEVEEGADAHPETNTRTTMTHARQSRRGGVTIGEGSARCCADHVRPQHLPSTCTAASPEKGSAPGCPGMGGELRD